MARKYLLPLVAAASMVVGAQSASATTSFTLTFAPGQSSTIYDTPRLTLTNTSTTEFLTGFSISMPSNTTSTGYNVDRVTSSQVSGNVAPAIGVTPVTPNTTSDGPNGAGPGRSTNGFSLTFTGFNPGDGLYLNPDFDPNFTNANNVDYRTFLFGPNTTATATFNNGTSLSLTLNPADTSQTSFSFGASETSAVPEPASWAMMMIGFGAVGGGMRRKRGMKTRVQFAA